jgi:Na+/melibiose symporter-like transporter
VIIVVGALLFVDESRQPDGRRVDLGGAALSIIASASLVFALIEGRTLGWWGVDEPLSVGGWSWPLGLSPVPIAFAVAVLAGVALVLWARARERAGRSAMLAIGLFRLASFRNGNLAAMIVSLGEFGIILALPIWLQSVLGYTAVQTGLVLLALALGSFVASGFAGAFGNRVAPVLIVRVGLAAEIVGVAGIGLVVSDSTPWWALVPFLAVYGFGVGLATAQLTGVVLRDVPVELSGQGSGTQSTARQIGSALGIAVLGTILYTSTAGVLTTSLEQQGLPAEQVATTVDAVVDSSGAAIAGLAASPATADAARAAGEAFSDGTRYAAFAAAGFLAVGFLATLSLGRPAEEEETVVSSAEPSRRR